MRPPHDKFQDGYQSWLLFLLVAPSWIVLPTDCQWGESHLEENPLVATLQNETSVPFHRPCLFIGVWVRSIQTPLPVTVLEPHVGRLCSRDIWLPRISPRRAAAMTLLRNGWGARGSWLAGSEREALGDILRSCCNHVFLGSSRFPLCLLLVPTYAFPWWKGNMHREEVMRFKTKSTGAHWANFSLSMKCYWGILPIVLTHVWFGGPFVWEKYLLGTLLISGDPLRGCVIVLSSGVWVCVPFVWLALLLPFVKWEIQVQLIRKL